MNLSLTEVNESIQAKNRNIEQSITQLKSQIGRVEDYAKEDLIRGLADLKK